MKNLSIRSNIVIIPLALVAVFMFVQIEKNKVTKWSNDFTLKEQAKTKMQLCIDHLKAEAHERHIPIDPINDPEATGLIGPRFSLTTSGRGSLSAKSISIDPNAAALMIELLQEAGLKQGDLVAIGMTGSFPGMNLASIIAAEVLDLEVIALASVSSSSWGANNPEFTWIDMHETLRKNNMISSKILAASIGANQDIGRSLSPEGREIAKESISRNAIQAIVNGSLEENVQDRIDMIRNYESKNKQEVQAYINVGGGVASIGSISNLKNIPNGILEKHDISYFNNAKAMAPYYLVKGQKVINIQNIESLFKQHGLIRSNEDLILDPVKNIYKEQKYQTSLAWSFLSILTVLISSVVVIENKNNALGTKVIPLAS